MFKKQKIVFGTCVYFKKKSWTYGPKINFLIRTKIKKKLNREERRDEIEERRQNEKKSWSAVRKKMGFLWKKLTKEGSYIYEVAIKNGCFVFKITSTHILKHTVKTMVFQQYFPNNSCLNPLTKHLFFLFGH